MPDRLQFEPLIAFVWQGNDSHFNGAVDDLLAGLLRIHEAQFELDFGVIAGEFAQYGR